MLSRWTYILIGNNETGKTWFQKELIKILCEKDKSARLDTNQSFEITNDYAIRKIKTIFVMNRSFHEKDYESIDKFFEKYFRQEDICILSSHLVKKDIEDMIRKCHENFYNVCGIFWAILVKKI